MQALELISVLESPIVTKEEKHRVIDRIFDEKISILSKRWSADYGKAGHHAGDLSMHTAQYKNEIGRHCDRPPGLCGSSDRGTEKRLWNSLCAEEISCKEAWSWEMEERPSLIGGFLLHVNGREYDYEPAGTAETIRTKIDLEVKNLSSINSDEIISITEGRDRKL